MKQSNYNLHKREKEAHIIYNTMSGGVLSLNNEYSKKFDEVIKNESDEYSDLIDELKKGQMLIQSNIDEFKYLKYAFNENRFNNKILSLTIAPTLDCNFRCPYCYEKGVENSYMNDETQVELLEFIKHNIEDRKMLSICWYGGEPLLSIDIIEKLTAKIKAIIPDSCKYVAGMVSNGYYLTPEMAKVLEALDIKRLQITIDGPRFTHDKTRVLENGNGSFDVITSNLKDICTDLGIIIRVNVNKDNSEYIYDFIKEMKELNLIERYPFYMAPVDNINNTCSSINCLTIPEFSKKEIEVYSALNKELNKSISLPDPMRSLCGAVSPHSFVISPDGSIYKCWNDIGRAEECVGTLKTGLTYNDSMLKWLNYEPMTESKCKICNVAPICMGGCPQKSIQNSSACSVNKFNITEKLELFCGFSKV